MPAFTSEADEARYWAEHGLAGEALESMGSASRDEALPPRTRPVSVRLDPDVLRRLKALAGKKGKGYQSLLKEFVVERLYEEEKREGLLAS